MLGRGRHQQHPGAGTAGERERHGNVSQFWEMKYVMLCQVRSKVLGMFETRVLLGENIKKGPIKLLACPRQVRQHIRGGRLS